MAIAAHPDDIEFSCCGTISKFVDKGYQAIYVILTNGESGWKIKEVPVEERIKTREKEQLEAAKVIKAKEVIFLREKDGFLDYTNKLREKIVALIKKYKPEIVFTFDPGNKDFSNVNLHHRDHRVCAEIVFDAVFAAKNKFMFPGKSHAVNKFYLSGSNKPNHYEDITAKIDLKVEALSKHKSQFTDFQNVKKFILERLSKFSEKYKYSEAFRIVEIKTF